MSKENPVPAGYDAPTVRRARQLRAEGMSVAEIARATGYSISWVKRAVKGEPVPPALRRRYAKDEERARAVQMRMTGQPPRVIASALGVSLTTVYRWTAASRPMTDVRRRQVERLAARSSAEDDLLRPQVLELRRAGLTYAQLEARLHLSGERIRRILGPSPPQADHQRPQAREQLRDSARALRGQGMSVPKIAAQLQVARSTAWLWTKDLPVPEGLRTRGTSSRQRAAHSEWWADEAARREQARNSEVAAAFAEVGTLTPRELTLVGAALYWAEGAKSKPWRRSERITFVNSDPAVIRLFMEWLRLNGIRDDEVRPRVQIHETADAAAAVLFWSGVIGIPGWRFGKTTLKRHNPRTNRKNRENDQYHGCLCLYVYKSGSLYRRVAGLWHGIVAGIPGSQASA